MAPQAKISNLVLEGAGIGAIAYAGFLDTVNKSEALDLSQLKRVAGVSSGSIAALQLALNYSTQEMISEIHETDFKNFADAKGGILGFLERIFTQESLYAGEFLYRYIRRLIKAKTGNENLSFYELQTMKEHHPFKDLYVVATKLFMLDNHPQSQAFIFSHEHTPYARIADAIRASASLPYIFPPMRLYEEKDGRYVIRSKGNVFVDGGVIEVYPITLFDSPQYLPKSQALGAHNSSVYNPETLGLKLDSPSEINVLEQHSSPKNEEVIRGDFEYARALFYVLKNGQQNTTFVNEHDKDRTVFVSTLNISSTAFGLSNQQKEALLESGIKAANQYLEKVHTKFVGSK